MRIFFLHLFIIVSFFNTISAGRKTKRHGNRTMLSQGRVMSRNRLDEFSNIIEIGKITHDRDKHLHERADKTRKQAIKAAQKIQIVTVLTKKTSANFLSYS